jgi:hypothetical protein
MRTGTGSQEGCPFPFSNACLEPAVASGIAGADSDRGIS